MPSSPPKHPAAADLAATMEVAAPLPPAPEPTEAPIAVPEPSFGALAFAIGLILLLRRRRGG